MTIKLWTIVIIHSSSRNIRNICKKRKCFNYCMWCCDSAYAWHIWSILWCIVMGSPSINWVSLAEPFSWILQKDHISPMDEWVSSALSNYENLPDWQPHCLIWFLCHDFLFYQLKWANHHLQLCALFCSVVAPHICRLLLIDKISLISHNTKSFASFIYVLLF